MHDSIAFRTLASSALLSIALTATLAAQSPPTRPLLTRADSVAAAAAQRYRYRLLGVYDEDTGEPIEGVEVSDVLTGVSSPTSISGTVSLFFLPDGGSLVRLRKVGYEPQTLQVPITPADTAPVTVTMRHGAQQLATVTVKDSAPHYVSAGLNGAEDRVRSRSGGGYFIDEAEMRKHDNSTMTSTIVAKMQGLTPLQQKYGRADMVSTRNPCTKALGCRTPDCFVRVLIDGVPASTRPDFNRMSPSDYAIAEFYPGGASVPPLYGGVNSACGVLLLWTRER